jgi:hypothetical protein
VRFYEVGITCGTRLPEAIMRHIVEQRFYHPNRILIKTLVEEKYYRAMYTGTPGINELLYYRDVCIANY